MKGRQPFLLIAAATDPSAGAGLLLDLAVARRLGVPAVGVTSALTAQSAAGLEGLSPTRAPFLRQQLDALTRDLGAPAAIKVGALATPPNARVLARLAARYPKAPLVLDPLWRPSRGGVALIAGPAAPYRRALLALLRRAFLLTPNLPEARWLLDEKANSQTGRDAGALARGLLELGPGAVLLKGGHAKGLRVRDLLVTAEGGERVFEHSRRQGPYHGTGCLLSTAIAAWLARGAPLERAVGESLKLLDREIARARPLGRARVKQLMLP